MKPSIILALAATAAFSAPIAAMAQPVSVTVSGDVSKACVIGQPASVTLALGDLTGSDGRIATSLASGTPSQATTIANAWCNAPSTLTLDGAPLTLSPTPGYAVPDGFARQVTYDATLTGWSESKTDRPVVGDSGTVITAAGAYAATGDGLTLSISSLEALDASGTAANSTAVLEAGSYSGVVTITVATQ
ncbi:MAG: hypothetical protein GC145_02640 [Caulobacter sp.]|nr:hypothetical protein [Caulobacter sp.]